MHCYIALLTDKQNLMERDYSTSMKHMYPQLKCKTTHTVFRSFHSNSMSRGLFVQREKMLAILAQILQSFGDKMIHHL